MLNANRERTDITVLIEQKDFTPFANFRRASLTPSLGGTSTASSVTERDGIANVGQSSSTGKERRGQRTSTTLHASIDVPDSLLASLSSISIVTIQPNLLPLPTARPLVLLLQLSDYIPQELSTTPTSVCFPPMATPTQKSIQRALIPLKLAVSQLESAHVREGVAILAYSDNVHIPNEINTAAHAIGAHGVITPPFTPDLVEAAIHEVLASFAENIPLAEPRLQALARHAASPPISYAQPTAVYPPTPESNVDSLPQPLERRISEYVDPLDASHLSLDDTHDSHDFDDPSDLSIDSIAVGRRKSCPRADVPLERRGSVDTGGLSLATSSLEGNAGGGWAGWDSSPSLLADEEFDGSDLNIAQLILSMHLQASAALSNASSPTTSGNHHVHNRSHPLQPPTHTPQLHKSPSTNALSSSLSLTNVSVFSTNPRTTSRLLSLLGSWHFEPYLLSPPETLLCVQLLFLSLITSLSTCPDILPDKREGEDESKALQRFMETHMVPFIHDLSRLYRRENRYHSFIHALDVFQAIYTFLELEGRVTPIRDMVFLPTDESNTTGRWTNKRIVRTEREWSCLDLLSDSEIFLLALAAIGHDVGHPGNGNAFLKNAQAPLSKIYDDKSPLEKMHCSLLLRLLKRHGMGHLISSQTERGRQGRWLISGTVLATDMSWHFEWIEGFRQAMKERRILSRLREQYEQARSHLPAPVVDEQGGSTILVDERRGSAIKLDANGRIPASFALARQGSVTSPSTSYPHHTPGSGLYGAERRNSGANPSTGSVDRRSSTTELVLNPSSLGNNQWILEETELEKAIEEGRVDVNGWVRSEEAHKLDKLFVCQALMKCGDISNPCRPHSISRHWSTVLLEEWAAQALLERHLGLPVSVAADANEKVQCVGQVSFIKLFTQPLFDLVTESVPGLSSIAKQCMENRVLWEQRLATFEAPPTSSHVSQMVRPIPLALPILSPMARYAKTVIPLSLPNLNNHKKPPRAVRELAAMSPWHVIKSRTSGTSAGISSAGAGSGIWRSRPDSMSSTSTLSSLPGSTKDAIASPSTPTSTGFASSGYARSPASPTTFNISPFGLPIVTSGGEPTASPYSSGAGLSSVWDVEPEVAKKEIGLLRHGWDIRDGRKARQRGTGGKAFTGRRLSETFESIRW